VAITTASRGDNPSKKGELVFTKYGDQYFLHEVRCLSVDINAQVPTSKQEKRARTEVAKVGGGEEVLIAAR